MADDKNRLVAFEDFPTLPAMKFRVFSVIPLNGITMAYGHAKGGKSLTLQSQMLASAAEMKWCGFETRYGKGLYIASEGFYGILRRHAAWVKHHGITEPLDIRYWRGSVNFLNKEGSVEPFLRELERSKWRPENLTIDTVAKAMPGANDADTAVASLFCSNARYLHEALGDITINLVHHSTKYDDVFRGAGAWDADLDGMILVKKVEPKKTADKTPEEKAADFQRLLDTKASDIRQLRALDISAVHFRDADNFEPFRVELWAPFPFRLLDFIDTDELTTQRALTAFSSAECWRYRAIASFSVTDDLIERFIHWSL